LVINAGKSDQVPICVGSTDLRTDIRHYEWLTATHNFC